MSLKSPFARLFAAKTRSAEEDEDDVTKRKQKDGEDEVADPDDVEHPEGDDNSEEAKKARKAKKAKKAKAEGDDETDGEDEADSKMASARARERGRIAAIMSSEAAVANPAAALRLAVTTSMSRDAVVATLKDIGPAGRSGRDRLMGVTVPDVGSGGSQQPGGASSLASAIIAAGKRRRGEV